MIICLWSFLIDLQAVWILLGITAIAYLIRWLFPAVNPYFLFSSVKAFPSPSNLGRVRWLDTPGWLYQIALSSFALAFIDPHFLISRSSLDPTTINPTEGIAIYLIMDQSGSMAQKVVTRGVFNRREGIAKIDLLKQVTQKFIKDRPYDLIGLVAFARTAHVIAPLTLDHEMLQNELNTFNVVQSKEEDGTAMGYAIFKTAHLIAATRHFAQEIKDPLAPAYEIKSTIMIVITDGQQDPNPLDRGNRLRTLELEEAAQYAKNENIHLYIINIDPNFSSETFAPHRRLLQRITKSTGGDFYLIDDSQTLQEIYKKINELEKSPIERLIASPEPKRWSLYPFLVGLGLLCFLIAGILNLTWLRTSP